MYVGPFTSLYSQVWWAALPQVELPDEIKKRFNDSAMAILGYEVDQVRKKSDKDVDGSILTEDVSVPINVAYNVRCCPVLPSAWSLLIRASLSHLPQHHHDAYFTAKHSRMEKVPYDPNDKSITQMARADPHFLHIPVEKSPSPRGLPTSAHLAAGNGGEYRKRCLKPHRPPQHASPASPPPPSDLPSRPALTRRPALILPSATTGSPLPPRTSSTPPSR
jgi:hypothetical protein